MARDVGFIKKRTGESESLLEEHKDLSVYLDIDIDTAILYIYIFTHTYIYTVYLYIYIHVCICIFYMYQNAMFSHPPITNGRISSSVV